MAKKTPTKKSAAPRKTAGAGKNAAGRKSAGASAKQAPRSNQSRAGAAPKRASAPAQPKKKSKTEAADTVSPAEMLWKVALLLCTALIIVALLLASVKGGSVLNGIDPNATPAPPSAPVGDVDTNQTVTGSNVTPPPAPTPTPTPPPANPGGITINGQPVGQ